MQVSDFERTIDIWISTVKQFDFIEICKKPSEGSWSLGQVVVHLLHESAWYMDQAKKCLESDDNATELKTDDAIEMFRLNSFPNAIIEGPPTNQFVRQPRSKQSLLTQLEDLKTLMADLSRCALGSNKLGKTKHPGLNYLDAKEWLQFSDMHFRHHLRQRDRILAFLGGE